MDGTNGLKETAPVASSKLSLNVFTAPGKAMVGERPKPFGEALGFDPMTALYPDWVANQSLLMFGFPGA